MTSEEETERKTILITGGNTGLGYECARAIAHSASTWHILLACRHPEKGQEATQMLMRETGNTSIETMELDLASLESIRLCVQILSKRDIPPLHAVVCNAGTQVVRGTMMTKDGFETTFGVNHLGHFLLVNLLLRSLVPPARIVFVSSDTHDPTKGTRMPPPRYRDPKDLAWPTTHPDPAEQTESSNLVGRRRYTTSKLCNILCTYELTRRLEDEGYSTAEHPITVNAFNPGGMPDTGLVRDWPPLLRFLLKYIATPLLPVIRLFGVDVNTASISGKHLARLLLDPHLSSVSGKYFSGLKELPSSEESYDLHKARELWETSIELVKLTSAETILHLGMGENDAYVANSTEGPGSFSKRK